MENEIEILKQRIAELESKNQGQKERPEVVKEVLKEHFEKKPEDLPADKQISPQIIATAVQKISDQKIDEDDKDGGKHKKMMEELVQFAAEHGIVNAAAVVQKVDDPHLIDDFQAALAETFFKVH